MSLQSRSNMGDWPLCFSLTSLSAELSIDWLSIFGRIPVHAGSPHRSSILTNMSVGQGISDQLKNRSVTTSVLYRWLGADLRW
jgi:hypothetical protein